VAKKNGGAQQSSSFEVQAKIEGIRGNSLGRLSNLLDTCRLNWALEMQKVKRKEKVRDAHRWFKVVKIRMQTKLGRNKPNKSATSRRR